MFFYELLYDVDCLIVNGDSVDVIWDEGLWKSSVLMVKKLFMDEGFEFKFDFMMRLFVMGLEFFVVLVWMSID